MSRLLSQILTGLNGIDQQQAIDWLDHHIVNNPRKIILLFLIATGAFVLGLGNISTSSGTSQFTTDLPSEKALTEIDQEFSPSFSSDTGSTQLIQRDQNVLSRHSLLEMLRLQKRIEDRPSLRVESTSSAATIVAQELRPNASTREQQITAIRQATPTEVDRAVRTVEKRNEQFRSLLSTDFNNQSASAAATIGTVTHQVPAGLSTGAGQSGESPLTSIQNEIKTVKQSVDGDITVFGSGVVAQEFSWVLTDSLLITVPAALVFIIIFLVISYRDIADLFLGILSLSMALIWTLGFLGLAGIPFSNLLISVPPLLLAVGVDFGIHAINRYREERVEGKGIAKAMRVTTDQLTVAFFIVTGTTVIGFLANLTSALNPIKDFGLVAAVGIGFTFLIFGIFLPAAKVELDRLRERYPIPTFTMAPLGSEGSTIGSILQFGVVIAKRAPALLIIVVLLTSSVTAIYATGVSTSFSQEDFLPPEDSPDFVENLPEPFRPHEYTVRTQLNYLEDNFATTQGSSTTILLRTSMTRDSALDSIQRVNTNPPAAFATDEREAQTQSIITVIETQYARDPQFRSLIARNDPDSDQIPERNLKEIYEYLLDSSARDQALRYLAEDYGSTQIVYTTKSDASQEEASTNTRELAERFRTDATATGQTIVFQDVSDVILSSAISSLVVALIGSTVFLSLTYTVIEREPTLGIVNMVPVVVTITFVVGTMRALEVPLNSLTATILAITIGLGVDYSVHVVHRFLDERQSQEVVPALERTVRGTGGALLGSMLTTVSGIGVLSLAVFVAIQQFGLIAGFSIFYSFIASVVVLPSVLVIWEYFRLGHRSLLPLFGLGDLPWTDTESDN